MIFCWIDCFNVYSKLSKLLNVARWNYSIKHSQKFNMCHLYNNSPPSTNTQKTRKSTPPPFNSIFIQLQTTTNPLITIKRPYPRAVYLKSFAVDFPTLSHNHCAFVGSQNWPSTSTWCVLTLNPYIPLETHTFRVLEYQFRRVVFKDTCKQRPVSLINWKAKVRMMAS